MSWEYVCVQKCDSYLIYTHSEKLPLLTPKQLYLKWTCVLFLILFLKSWDSVQLLHGFWWIRVAECVRSHTNMLYLCFAPEKWFSSGCPLPCLMIIIARCCRLLQGINQRSPALSQNPSVHLSACRRLSHLKGKRAGGWDTAGYKNLQQSLSVCSRGGQGRVKTEQKGKPTTGNAVKWLQWCVLIFYWITSSL